MKFTFTEQIKAETQEPTVGNIYSVRGGKGARLGYMNVIVAANDGMVTVMTIDKEGEIVGASNYGAHYYKCPIAFCDGLEELSFNIRSIGAK